jgi:hypothetical protein
MFVLKIVSALKKAKVPYALVGGYAVALHGAVRGTLDVDLILRFNERNFAAAEKAFMGIGLRPRLPVDANEVFQFREEYIHNRNMTAWTFLNPDRPSEIVDVILTMNLADVMTRNFKIKGGSVRVIGLDDLIRMKEASGRPQDLEDVRALRALS